MTIHARMSDGTILSFPDDTADDVVDRAAREYSASRGGVEQTQPSPNGGVGRALGLGARAVMQGAAAPFGMVGDAINSAVNLPIHAANAALGTNIQPIGRASDAIQRGIDAITPRPATTGERIIDRVGTEIVGLAVPFGAGARLARGATAGARAVGEALTARPALQAGGALGAGVGGGVAQELAPDSAAANITGTAAGLVAGTAVPAVVGRGAAVVGHAIAPFTERGQQRIIGDALVGLSDNPATLQARLAGGQREIVPGSQRTTAEVANDTGLRATERGVRIIGPRETAQFAERDAARNTARRQAMELAPPVTQDAAGDAARTGINTERNRAAGDVRALYNSIPDDAGRFRAQDIYAQVMPDLLRIYGRSTAGMPAELRPIVNRLANSGTLSYGDLRAMSREMGDISGRSQVAGDRTLAAQAGAIRQAIDDMMGSPGGLAPQQMRAHNTAVAARRNMGAVYDEGAVGRAIDTNQFGRPTMPAESVPRALTSGPTAVRQTEAAVGGNQHVMDALRGAFIDTMQRRVGTATPDAAGNFADSAARFHSFVNQNRDAIRYLFGPQGEQNLDLIAQDFVSRQMVDSAGRAVGSNTVQNLSTAHVLSAALGGLINPRSIETNPLFRYTLGLAYRGAGSERAVQEMLTRAMLDPDFAQLLVSRASPQTIRRATAMMNQSFGGRLRDAAEGAVQPMVAPGMVAAGSTTERPNER